MEHLRERSLMAAILVIAICALTESTVQSAPAPPPDCDTNCWERAGPFITGGDDTGSCFRFASPGSCEYCNNTTGSYICEKNMTSKGSKCDVVYLNSEPPLVPVPIARYPITNPDMTKTACIKYCPRQAPGYEASKNDGSIDGDPITVFKKECMIVNE
jgi:hypothetical protein